MVQNRAVIFKKVPQGWPVAGEHLTVESLSDFNLDTAPPAGGITVKLLSASHDPYMRGRMRPAEVKSYFPAFTLGKPMAGHAMGKVLKSDSSSFQPGDLVRGILDHAEYLSIAEKEFQPRSLSKLSNEYGLDPDIFLGALGMPGLTAYSSLREIGKPKKGETIFISAASGAVGQLVGQLAKDEGLRVIGSVGSDSKLEYIIKELKFDGGFNYKSENASDALKRLAPNGVDIFYDNVGGVQLDAALDAMNNFGRIVASGMISQYNLQPEEQYGVKNLMNVVAKRLTIRGFIISDPDFGPKYSSEHQKAFAKKIHDGSIKTLSHTIRGIENGPAAFVSMLEGGNMGKAVLRIAEE